MYTSLGETIAHMTHKHDGDQYAMSKIYVFFIRSLAFNGDIDAAVQYFAAGVNTDMERLSVSI